MARTDGRCQIRLIAMSKSSSISCWSRPSRFSPHLFPEASRRISAPTLEPTQSLISCILHLHTNTHTHMHTHTHTRCRRWTSVGSTTCLLGMCWTGCSPTPSEPDQNCAPPSTRRSSLPPAHAGQAARRCPDQNFAPEILEPEITDGFAGWLGADHALALRKSRVLNWGRHISTLR